jgi:uncharacterized phage protein gp47/JayE
VADATFKKSFDELLDGILTDYRNQFPEADTSQGSLIFIKSACMASALWGLYNYQEWISKQIFPDTATAENMEHHAWVRGISRTAGETDSALLERLLEYIRRPPAGGNQYDYVKWAKEVNNVSAAYCMPLVRGLGTVDVLIIANKETTGSEIPSEALITDVMAYISDLCPVTHTPQLLVRGPDIVTQDVSITVTGAGADHEAISQAIKEYMQAISVGTMLYRTQLVALAVQNGAENVTVTMPAQDVSAEYWELIRPGVINVA